ANRIPGPIHGNRGHPPLTGITENHTAPPISLPLAPGPSPLDSGLWTLDSNQQETEAADRPPRLRIRTERLAAALAGALSTRGIGAAALETIVAGTLGAGSAGAVLLTVAIAGIADRHAGARGTRSGHVGCAADESVIAIAIGASGARASVAGAGARSHAGALTARRVRAAAFETVVAGALGAGGASASVAGARRV